MMPQSLSLFVGLHFIILRRVRVLCRLFNRVFGFTPGILRLAFHLLRGAFYLSLSIAGPFTSLAFYAPRHIFDFAFNTIFIHDSLRFHSYFETKKIAAELNYDAIFSSPRFG